MLACVLAIIALLSVALVAVDLSSKKSYVRHLTYSSLAGQTYMYSTVRCGARRDERGRLERVWSGDDCKVAGSLVPRLYSTI